MGITHRQPDLEAKITFIPTSAGGRTTAALSGYRVDHDFGLPGVLHVATHEYIGCESVAPGESAMSVLWLMAPDLQRGRLYPGFRFTVQEGARVVGHGVVEKVLNRELAYET